MTRIDLRDWSRLAPVDPLRRAAWVVLAIYMIPALCAVLCVGAAAIALRSLAIACGLEISLARSPGPFGLGRGWGPPGTLGPARAR